jgi:hypothetical protein
MCDQTVIGSKIFGVQTMLHVYCLPGCISVPTGSEGERPTTKKPALCFRRVVVNDSLTPEESTTPETRRSFW